MLIRMPAKPMGAETMPSNDERADGALIDAGEFPNLQICSDDRDFYRIAVCSGGTVRVN